ncbi:MAG TPA: M14 family zinc carboxypeptidase [Armatimonadota bacterium]|nr:M14 family zinc carboxypeptidase [Armatimonadota bacterium]
MTRALRRRLPPRIITPDFWPATHDRFDELLGAAQHCTVEHIGTSAGGRAIHGVKYRGRSDMPTLAVIGGIHGHEPQGPAACFNLVSVLGYGRDLKGTPWPDITDELNYLIVPIANPDARGRMPNAFVGLASQDILHYDAGMTLAGERHEPGDKDCDPDQMMILGGLFNDAGQHINRDSDPANIRSPEIRAIISFIEDHQPDIALEFHAHAPPPMLILPSKNVPEDVQARQQGICDRIVERAAKEGIQFQEQMPRSEKIATSLYYHFSGAIPILYESPQGVLDSMANWTHQQIIDGCMFVVSCLCRELTG